MDWDEFTNALEWYAAAPARWYESGKKDLQAAAEWIWTVLQGDFAEEQTTAQIVTGTIISIIPFVDQICDVRDLIACCRKIREDGSNKWAWIALVLTLIGLFPELGSLAKGGGKILFAYGRKSVFRAGKGVATSEFWAHSKPFVEAGIGKLNQYLQTPAVRKTLKALSIHNPYHFLSGKVRVLSTGLSTGKLLHAFDKVLPVLRSLVGKIQRWGGQALGTRAGRMLQSVVEVRRQANRALGEVLAPVKQWLEKLARRLEIEGDMNYRAAVNSVNPHHAARLTLEAEEVAFKKAKPSWVDDTGRLVHKPMRDPPSIPDGWPDINATKPPLKKSYETFHDAEHELLKPGERLVRVVDPNSYDDGICWMSEADFKALMSKPEWRRKFAVWANWNGDGEFVTYTVPRSPEVPLEDDGLKVWKGPTASQQLRKGSIYTLEGGGNQIVVDPADLKVEAFGKRQPTGWGYHDFPGDSDAKLGLPKLTNNLHSLQDKTK